MQSIFVDGNNFYHSLKGRVRGHVDMRALARLLLGGEGEMRYYTALPEHKSPHEGFLEALRRQGWEIVRGEIRGGREKGSDVSLALDLVLAALRGLKRAVVVSGDGDLAPAVRRARELGCRVEVASFAPYLSPSLKEAADRVILLEEVPWEALAYRRQEVRRAAG